MAEELFYLAIGMDCPSIGILHGIEQLKPDSLTYLVQRGGNRDTVEKGCNPCYVCTHNS